MLANLLFSKILNFLHKRQIASIVMIVKLRGEIDTKVGDLWLIFYIEK